MDLIDRCKILQKTHNEEDVKETARLLAHWKINVDKYGMTKTELINQINLTLRPVDEITTDLTARVELKSIIEDMLHFANT